MGIYTISAQGWHYATDANKSITSFYLFVIKMTSVEYAHTTYLDHNFLLLLLHSTAPAISIQNSSVPPEDFLPVTMTSNSSLLYPPPPPYRPGSPALSDRSTPYSSPAASPVPSPSASPLHSPFYSPCPSPTPPIHRSNPSGTCVNAMSQ